MWHHTWLTVYNFLLQSCCWENWKLRIPWWPEKPRAALSNPFMYISRREWNPGRSQIFIQRPWGRWQGKTGAIFIRSHLRGVIGCHNWRPSQKLSRVETQITEGKSKTSKALGFFHRTQLVRAVARTGHRWFVSSSELSAATGDCLVNICLHVRPQSTVKYKAYENEESQTSSFFKHLTFCFLSQVWYVFLQWGKEICCS